MLRFIYVIVMHIHRIWMIPLMGYYAKHPEKYSEKFRYEYDRHAIHLMQKRGRIHTDAYGLENLPQECGYVMFANHQGKYDALGIMDTHDSPCSLVMDDARSHIPLVQQFVDLVQGKRLKLDDVRQGARVIREVAGEVKTGRKFIIFPAGGYAHRNGNYVDAFKPGCFKSAMRARAPIVPVAIVDSWKVFDLNSLRRVKTQVYYLKPLVFEEYRHMKSVEIAELVYHRICAAVQAAEAGHPEIAVQK
ncbi:MAG: lysophospholipid acyltransferase family protein [Eubacteriales bacterium]|nr:lysophospholipid acyltransferase family protein [Eubacteriales bacterium]